jgi:hypothetical protein
VPPRKLRGKSPFLYFSFFHLATSSSQARMEGRLEKEEDAKWLYTVSFLLAGA